MVPGFGAGANPAAWAGQNWWGKEEEGYGNGMGNGSAAGAYDNGPMESAGYRLSQGGDDDFIPGFGGLLMSNDFS
ncbi:hypothetical protein VKT23_020235 [Stygiomarasmius scandens]|uniref:Bindin n=1 Tax=Marasmiellus scandens TaxID=2682957 RepID=A0ABR1ILE4_9AGAR